MPYQPCKTCVFWHAIPMERWQEDNEGECRCHPPQLFVNPAWKDGRNAKLIAAYPTVSIDKGCGDGEDKEC